MLFQDILKIHSETATDVSHSEILGDGFLRTHNPVYQRIMSEALRIGVTFTRASAEYLLLPFNQLDQIVASKLVPFVPHARLMADVESRHPGVFDLDQMPMPESYHLHEAAHVIADQCCKELQIEGPQDRVLKAILCESFANTVDAMACGFADSETHRLLLKLNCYMHPALETHEVMSGVRARLGEGYTAHLVLLSYLHANFLREDVPVALLGEGAEDEECLMLSTIGQQLDMLFRVQTTQNYFQLRGLEGEVYDLVGFDFMQLLRRPDFSAAVDALVRRVCPR